MLRGALLGVSYTQGGSDHTVTLVRAGVWLRSPVLCSRAETKYSKWSLHRPTTCLGR